MATTANARMTIGTLLGSVNEAANTVADTFSTATKAVGMVNNYVSTAAEKQRVRNKLELASFTNQLLEEKAMEDTVRRIKIEEFCKDENNATYFQESYDKLAELLK